MLLLLLNELFLHLYLVPFLLLLEVDHLAHSLRLLLVFLVLLPRWNSLWEWHCVRAVAQAVEPSVLLLYIRFCCRGFGNIRAGW